MRREGLGCLICEADRARVMKSLFRAAETGSTLEMTFRLTGADGKTIWVQAHAVLIRKEGNKPVYQAVITPTSVREKMYQNVLDDSFSAVAVNDDKTNEQLYMGRDGAQGLREMHDAGAYTLGQNQATCAVFGMPCAADRLGAVDRLLPPELIAEEIIRYGSRFQKSEVERL